MLVKMFHGFCMALADSVPGVSGGTVAFIPVSYTHLCVRDGLEHGDPDLTIAKFTKAVERFANMN